MTEAENLKTWQDSGEAHRWAWQCSGAWCDAEYAQLLASLRTGPFWPLNEDDILTTLEEAAKTFRDLQRWGLLGNEGQGRAAPASPTDEEISF